MLFKIMDEFVNVVIRIRPSLSVLEESLAVKFISSKPPVLYAGNRQSYTFNGIFTSMDSQEVVYNDVVKPLIQKVLLGYNCTVFAYGQTGTGKTYTIGSDPKMYSDAGFIVRSFDEILTYQEQHKELEVYISFYEIYNDKVYDLLSPNKTSLQVKGFKIETLKRIQVQTKEEAQHYLDCGSRNRHIGETKLNTTSSRSHAIFIVYCKQLHENYAIEAKLNLVDLAGSENVRKTGNEGSQFQEGVNINIGLFNVRRVISALSTNKTHIPYRESMITTVLQDSLSKKNFVTLVACISPDSQDLNETIQTLEFAQGAKKIKNRPEVNSIIEQYKKENPTLFERPLFTSTALKQRITPLKFQNRSMECTTTTSSVKKPKIINHTWTPVSTIAKPQIEDPIPESNISSKFPPLTPIPESNIPSKFPPLTPIVLKCFQLLENTWTEKLTTIMKLQKVAEKRRTPEFSWQDMQSEVSQIVRSEIVQMSKQRLVACSSPIDDQNISGISVALSDDALPIARRLKFDDVESKISTSCVQLRRSTRLSSSNRQLTNVSMQDPVPVPASRNMNDSVFKVPSRRPVKTKHNNILRRSTRLSFMSNTNGCDNRRQSLRIQEKRSPPQPSPRNNLSKLIPTPAPRTTKKDDVRKKHVKSILSLLNYGSEKDMQRLPCIGPKTAKQISFYREINGLFSRISDLNEIGWRGSGYQRFLKSNFLIEID